MRSGIDNLYDPRHVQLVNHLSQALKAESLYKRDVDYVIEDGEVKIVDEYTGRIMEGRRWSEGLHQAIEAKEGVEIREENVTLATITLQNYFRLYEKLGGMTGTAKTEEKEFVEIYNLHVVEIPTNVAVTRKDENDFIFKSKEAKWNAVAEDLIERHEKGQPVLVGTIAVETSEYLSELLTRRGIPHNVLNAKEHERESEIIVDAGLKGAVTIATNMAGRGVDIKIDDEVRDLGGLYVLGTERHESRRIDNQLRGRSGRQGDPGETRFYLSAQDDLVRLFAGDRIHGIMERFKIPDDQPMEASILSRQIEGAQKKVEEQNFVARKNVLKYDDVMNTQRMVIYEQRRSVLNGDDTSDEIRHWIEEVVGQNVVLFTGGDAAEDWDSTASLGQMTALYGCDITVDELREEVELTRESLIEEFSEDALETYDDRETSFGPELMREIERFVILQVVDTRWREHLESMDYLREGVHLRAMAQKDPLVEYRGEGHMMFEELSRVIREEVVVTLFHVEVQQNEAEQALQPAEAPQALSYEHEISAGADAIAAAGGAGQATAVAQPPVQRQVVKDDERDVGRNDPCWCGSGKKFKRCHGGRKPVLLPRLEVREPLIASRAECSSRPSSGPRRRSRLLALAALRRAAVRWSPFDDDVSRWVADNVPGRGRVGRTRSSRWLGGPVGTAVVAGAAAVVLCARRRRTDAAFVVLSVDRDHGSRRRSEGDLRARAPRPRQRRSRCRIRTRFPSGHAATAVVLYGALGLLLAERARSHCARRRLARRGGGHLALAIGASRDPPQRPFRHATSPQASRSASRGSAAARSSATSLGRRQARSLSACRFAVGFVPTTQLPSPMADQENQPLAHLLEELGAQLDWVREYL